MPGQAPARRMAKFSLRAELQFALGSGRRPKARPGLGERRRTPAQWAAAAESTAACSMADPGSRMSMDPPPLLYRPLVGLYVCSSNRGRGCTMQELRALSFGPQKYATPGKRLPERRPCPAGQDMSASQVTTAELDASCLLHAV